MIRALFRKELRDQRPFLLLSLVLAGTFVVDSLVTRYPDAYPLSRSWHELTEDSTRGVLALYAFALASGLLLREREEGTLAFLDGLATTRLHIFAVKIAVALMAIMLFPIVLAGWFAVLNAASRSSVEPTLHFDLIAAALATDFAMAVVMLSLGLLLSFVGRLNWLVLGVLACTLMFIEKFAPSIHRLMPTALSEPDLDGVGWKLPAPALRWQLPIAGGCLLASYALFRGASIGGAALEKFARRPRVSFAVGLVTAFVAVLACVLAFGNGKSDDAPSLSEHLAKGVKFHLAAPARAKTAHYDFSYPSNRQDRVEVLLAHGDEAFEKVRAFLQVEPGAVIAVDAAGSMRNTEGTAYWNHIRLDLSDDSPEVRLSSLAHETTHVLANRLARRDVRNTLDELLVFNEGLARYVEGRFFQPFVSERDEELVMAVMRERGEVSVDELVDRKLLASRRDDGLKYPLGALLVSSMVERCSDESVHRVLQAVGRDDAPKHLAPYARWADAFQTAGCDFTAVLDRFFERLDDAVKKRRKEIDALPRPRGALETSRKWVGIRAVFLREPPSGWTATARFRPAADSGIDEYDAASAGDDGVFWRARSQVSGSRLWYQLGLRSPSGVVLYEPWASVPIE